MKPFDGISVRSFDTPPGWSCVRVDSVLRPIRRSVSAEWLSGREVFHYSIPSIEQTGDGQLEDGTYIDSGKLLLQGGEVLVSKLNPRKGRVLIAKSRQCPVVASGEFVALDPRGILPRFAAYLLSSDGVRQFLASAVHSVTRSHQRVDPATLTKAWIAVPGSDEQRAISAFLDGETAKVDELVRKKQLLLSLLRLRQDAIICRLVAGMESATPKRYSGYSWLGDVPAHWNVLALKRIAKRVVVGIAEASTHAYADSGVPLVRTTNVKANRIDASDLLYINQEFADKNCSKYMRAGDIVTARTGNPGVSGVVAAELDGSQCFTMLITTLREPHVPEFFCYYINSDSARTYFALEGWGTAQINISVPILQMLPVPCPPEGEQRQIAKKIENSVSESQRQLDLISAAIERLREYRLSLISAAVIGQIDVRNYHPQEADVLCR
jgi:type I restriction enzyme, S subunit